MPQLMRDLVTLHSFFYSREDSMRIVLDRLTNRDTCAVDLGANDSYETEVTFLLRGTACDMGTVAVAIPCFHLPSLASQIRVS